MLDTYASPRPGTPFSDDINQDFTVKYRKPFKGTGISDATLYPLKDYNLTSYIGCYKNSAANVEDGIDPNIAANGPGGCRERWQSQTGVIVYSSYVDGKEISNSAKIDSKNFLEG